MKKFAVILAIALLLPLALSACKSRPRMMEADPPPPAVNEPEPPPEPEFERVKTISAKGQCVIGDGGNRFQAKLMAKKGAVIDARRKLLEKKRRT